MRIDTRRATPKDVDWLVTQLRAFSEFMGTRLPLFGSEELVRVNLATMIDSHVVLIAEREDGLLMGFIGGVYIPHVFNPEIRVLSETFWWVSPEHRNTRAGLLLLNAFVDFGKAHADWITVALEEKSPVSDRCLTKRGFRTLEKNYLLEVS
jgi:hypothetical protein